MTPIPAVEAHQARIGTPSKRSNMIPPGGKLKLLQEKLKGRRRSGCVRKWSSLGVSGKSSHLTTAKITIAAITVIITTTIITIIIVALTIHITILSCLRIIVRRTRLPTVVKII